MVIMGWSIKFLKVHSLNEHFVSTINDYYVTLQTAHIIQYVNEHFVSTINDYYVTLQTAHTVPSVYEHFVS